MQRLIIDGYNVIHADDGLKRVAERDMQQARNRLLQRIRGYLERKSVRATLVFDGRGGLTDAEVVVPGRLQVLYSAHGQTADELIVETVIRSPNPREYIVVTSDMSDIGRTAGAEGATVMRSDEFLARLDAGEADPTARADAGREKPEPDDDDVAYWLERFERPDANETD